MSALSFRLARPDEFDALRPIIIDSFEPITWYKKVDDLFGPLNGLNWYARWQLRLDKVLATQIILVGEQNTEIAAVATGTYTESTRLGFVDLLAVALPHQGKGLGRDMLRGMLDHLRSLGAQHAHLDCLTDNDRGNALYAAEGWTNVTSSNHWLIKL
ncbi:MAG: GNAT family N-acetyltransferase [Acidobacteria bacterium]|nr:GNAT family N-acetyltransferase [Acidobacteriota bacterium]